MPDQKLVFPREELTKIGTTGTISFQEAKDFDIDLLDDLYNIPSSYGNGNMGHLHLALTAAEYLLESNNIPYVPQPFPGPAPVHPVGATGPVMAEINRQFLANQEVFRLNALTNVSVKARIFKAYPDQCLQALHDPITGYRHVTIQQVRLQTRTKYGTISEQLLSANLERAQAPFDMTDPIEKYINRLATCRSIAAAGGDAISNQATIRFAIAAMTVAGQYKSDLHTRTNLRRQPNAPVETWATFRDWLVAIDKTRREELTTEQAGFNAQANAVIAAEVASQVAEQMNIMSAQFAAQANAAIAAKPTQAAT
jgi:hypothetical protein